MAQLTARAEAASGYGFGGVVVLESVNDARLFDVLRGHFHFNSIAHRELDKVFAEFARNVGKHLMTVEYFHPEHCPGQNCYDFSLDFYGI